MKYILTQKEYNELRQAQKVRIGLKKEKLQQLCTKIANEMPVVWGRNGPDPKPLKPWGCIIDNQDEWYCDLCPVIDICPNKHKEFSK